MAIYTHCVVTQTICKDKDKGKRSCNIINIINIYCRKYELVVTMYLKNRKIKFLELRNKKFFEYVRLYVYYSYIILIQERIFHLYFEPVFFFSSSIK